MSPIFYENAVLLAFDYFILKLSYKIHDLSSELISKIFRYYLNPYQVISKIDFMQIPERNP